MPMEITLKGLVISKYGSCVKFARHMEWNRNKAARIINGQQEPTLDDIKDMANKQAIPKEMIVPLFFGTMFT